jgi:uncharacterized protein
LAKRNKPLKDRLRDAIWPRMGVRRYLTYLKTKVLRLTASPHAIAAGVASGAAVSCFPFVGVHFILGFILAFLLRGNMLAAAIGTAWGNPITFPFLFSAAYQLGSLILNLVGTRTPANAEAIVDESTEIISQGVFGGSLETILPTIGTMCVGATPISLVVFGVFYGIVFTLVKRFQTNRSERLLRRALLRGQVSEE